MAVERCPFMDPHRWEGFRARAGDVVIATPFKSGTTWMQEIVASLLWPDGPPAPGSTLSPWLDSRTHPIEEVLARLDAMEHRRVVKTHLPADALPRHDEVRYVVVLRRPADALVSWANHRRGMTSELRTRVAAIAEREEADPLTPWDGGDPGALFDEWTRWEADPVHHLAAWLPRLDDDVLLLHYAELGDDLDREMRQVAAFLGIEVDERTWPAQVDRCRFDSMRASYGEAGVFDFAFDGGADRFFHRGESGRGASELSAETQQRCRDLARSLLPPEWVAWLER